MPSSRWERIARLQGRLLRYLMLSVLLTVAGEAMLAFFFGALHWSALRSNLAVVAIGTGPAYYMARRFVWKLHGRSHFRREVLPFWVFSVAGALLSTVAADIAERVGRSVTDERQYQTVLVMGGTLFAYGLVWALRFFALDAVFERARVSAAEALGPPRGTDEPRVVR